MPDRYALFKLDESSHFRKTYQTNSQQFGDLKLFSRRLTHQTAERHECAVNLSQHTTLLLGVMFWVPIKHVQPGLP
jgi:hypothetical protein